jgi:hypothetical protein
VLSVDARHGPKYLPDQQQDSPRDHEKGYGVGGDCGHKDNTGPFFVFDVAGAHIHDGDREKEEKDGGLDDALDYHDSG